MGENEGWAEPGGPLPNGLLPGAGPVMRALDTERWSRAEERTADLIACIQPNQLSEERRNAVAEYVQRLIMKCFPCQVCTFGSVPLKTYLPDGDIDLTAFSHDQNLKDTWANQVRDMLQNEERNENAEFHVKEVQYIQAEVKIIKCLVENIVVDISFNQVGGLCTLCFLDEVDNLINQNHLFKRSIILIKAWCYYESRILGAHHGLISTYALETLVLYIFHVFNNSFHGPLEVLYRFLDFFSNFDWDSFCVSLWGPVPISSLPDVTGIESGTFHYNSRQYSSLFSYCWICLQYFTAEPPRKDSGDLLLSKLFLDACSSVYAVFPGGQENNGQPFVSKHFNVIDPLRVNNNLGRSVSKGNFFRIRSAFAFGAKRLARLLDCPEENLTFEVNQFFMNTWERHGSGHRPDAPGVDSWRMSLSTPDGLHEFGNSSNNWSGNNVNQNSSVHEIEDKGIRDHGASSQHGKVSARMMPITSDITAPSHTKSLKSQNINSLRVADQIGRDYTSDQVLLNDEVQGVRRNRNTETVNAHAPSAKLDNNNGRKNLESESLASHISRSSVEDTSSVRHVPSKQSLDVVTDSMRGNAPGRTRYCEHDGICFTSRLQWTTSCTIQFKFASSTFLNPAIVSCFDGIHSTKYARIFPTNIPMIDPSFSNVQFPPGLVSPQLTHYFPGVGVNSPSEASFEQSSENFGSMEMNPEEVDNNFWQEQDVCSSGGYDPENGKFDMLQSDEKPPALVPGSKYVPPHRARRSDSGTRVQQKHTREKHGSVRQNSHNFPIQDDRSSEVYAEERSASSRFSSATHSNSLRSRTSSESSWDGSSVKTPKSKKEKREKKIVSTDLATSQTSHGKGKIMSEHVTNQAENEDQEWGSLSNTGVKHWKETQGQALRLPSQVDQNQ
ncbi:hypothetical protein DH2020_023084 [Rehmannia glutinosa]|uniref:Polymerase nucleotidyl transferase domain-containing protein n=1 Tax=Rehmannia glutinosa TaxID=99300 RepID=A0ABR0W7L8_REHGL